jgi:hypothetical protein
MIWAVHLTSSLTTSSVIHRMLQLVGLNMMCSNPSLVALMIKTICLPVALNPNSSSQSVMIQCTIHHHCNQPCHYHRNQPCHQYRHQSCHQFRRHRHRHSNGDGDGDGPQAPDNTPTTPSGLCQHKKRDALANLVRRDGETSVQRMNGGTRLSVWTTITSWSEVWDLPILSVSCVDHNARERSFDDELYEY